MRIFLLYLALVTSQAYGACSTCPFTAFAGTINETCGSSTSSVNCLKGQISVKSLQGATVFVDRATCLSGAWYGSSCGGGAYELIASPRFDCGKEPEIPLPEGCACAFENTGASLNLVDPVSSCLNAANHMLECDDKIFVKNVGVLEQYDRLSCSGGKWIGSNCDGTLSALNAASVSVQCGAVAEPTFPSLLPNRADLRFIGTVNGYKRYACPDHQFIKFKVPYSGRYFTAHSGYIECNDAECSRVSSTGEGHETRPVSEVSCRDYGINPGGYPHEIEYFDNTNTLRTLGDYQTEIQLTTAKCGIDGWSITGTNVTGIRLASFWCFNSANKGSCPRLKFAETSNYQFAVVRYLSMSEKYECWNGDADEMIVTTPDGQSRKGQYLQCDAGTWVLFGPGAIADILPQSKVDCRPRNAAILPLDAIQLIYAGRTTDGLARWTCIDEVLSIDVEIDAATGTSMTVHAPYIELNNTYYRIASSDANYNSNVFGMENQKIKSISCIDMGAKHSACTEPWTISGERKGNTFKCKMGYVLNTIYYIDILGIEHSLLANKSDMKIMKCQKDGWQPQGTSLSGLRVSGFYCQKA